MRMRRSRTSASASKCPGGGLQLVERGQGRGVRGIDRQDGLVDLDGLGRQGQLVLVDLGQVATGLARARTVAGQLELPLQGCRRLLREPDFAKETRQCSVARTCLRYDVGGPLGPLRPRAFSSSMLATYFSSVSTASYGRSRPLLVELGQLEGLATHLRAFEACAGCQSPALEHRCQLGPALGGAIDVFQSVERLDVARLEHQDRAGSDPLRERYLPASLHRSAPRAG